MNLEKVILISLLVIGIPLGLVCLFLAYFFGGIEAVIITILFGAAIAIGIHYMEKGDRKR